MFYMDIVGRDTDGRGVLRFYRGGTARVQPAQMHAIGKSLARLRAGSGMLALRHQQVEMSPLPDARAQSLLAAHSGQREASGGISGSGMCAL
jgi:hypothetical protein